MTAEASTTDCSLKKEDQNDEIKNFAETAMNELLGWYGYERVAKLDLQPRTLSLASSIDSRNLNRSELSTKNNTQREDISKYISSRENSRSPCSIKNTDIEDNLCGWCRKEIPENSPNFLTTPDGPQYCSESCFFQSRRASFKKAKSCDWCRHIRHAVSYVDFQDGATQLQFCSGKCLNQYKMQIFCKETQAHLDMNPHLKEKGSGTSGGLITPDLWLKNCHSRSVSPISESSRSPSPSKIRTSEKNQQLIRKPIISVAPVSKLMSKHSTFLNIRHLTRHTRKRKNSKITTSQKNNDNIDFNSNYKSNSKTQALHIKTPSSSKSSMPSPDAISNSGESLISPSTSKEQITQNRRTSFVPLYTRPLFTESPRQLPTGNATTTLPHPTLFGASVPPITVMVPYPIIIPLPIPIPIPLPVSHFIKLEKKSNDTSSGTMSTLNTTSYKSETEQYVTPSEPLDFTTTKDVAENENLKINSSESNVCHNYSDTEENNVEFKFNSNVKITRLNTKKLPAKEAEKFRPLRKRKRVIDYNIKNSKDDANRSTK